MTLKALIIHGDDNLANMIIIAGVMTGVFQIPGEIVFGRVLPGLGVALVVGLGFYAWQARRLARREGRDDVTALPYGISTPVMFVYLFGIIGFIGMIIAIVVALNRDELGMLLSYGVLEPNE